MRKHIWTIVRKAFCLASVVALSIPARAGSYEDLWHAVEVDNTRALVTLLKSGIDPNSRNDKGQVAIFVALQGGSIGVADMLLDQPALDVNAANKVGETPLMMAALKGRIDVMKRLIERGARIHQPGWSPIHYAASGEEPKAVALLLDRGAPVDALAGGGVTPLMMAAMYGSEGGVDLLLARGADRSLRNAKGETAADRAAKAGRDALAKKLAPSENR